MRQALLGILMMNCVTWLASGQSSETIRGFEFADVRVSPKSLQSMRPASLRGSRYELKNATVVDLVRMAYGFDSDKILGGPSWLEMDRFDIVAKLRPGPPPPPDDRKLVLQRLLEERFKLVVKKEDRPLTTYALTAGKKPLLKEAKGTEEPGCKMPSERMVLGPGSTIQFQCRNMTMAAFAGGLRGMIGVSLGQNPVLDETGLTGKWNFDVKWSIGINAPVGIDPDGPRITVFEAVEKQLGLKLEERRVPMPVIVVESVNRVPTENPPGTAEALPPVLVERFGMKYHTEERPVTVLKLTANKPRLKEADPASRTFCRIGSAPAGSPPGSQAITCQNITMDQLAERVQFAVNISFPVENATGIEGGWDFSVVYTQTASARPAGGAGPGNEAPTASDPSGGDPLLEAFQRIGLKLEQQKKPMPVIVIDHLEEKATEN